MNRFRVKDHRRLLLHGDRPRHGDPHLQWRPWCPGGRHAALGGGPRAATSSASRCCTGRATSSSTSTRPAIRRESPCNGDPEQVLEPVDARATRHDRRTHGSPPRLEIRRARRHRPRSSGLSPRHPAPREHRVRSHAHRLTSMAATATIASVRRSCSAWAAQRCSAPSTCTTEHLPPERRTLGAAHALPARLAARRTPAVRARRSRHRGGAASLRVHDAHAGPGGPRQVPDRAGARASSATRTSRCSRRRTVSTDGDAQYDASGAAPRALRERRRDEAPRSVAGNVSELSRSTRSRTACTRGTWTSPAFQRLFDRRIPEWRTRQPVPALRRGHSARRDSRRARRGQEGDDRRGRRAHGCALDPKVFTIGFARRATPYKRADLDLHRPRRGLPRSRRPSDRSRSFSAARHIRTTAAARISSAASSGGRRALAGSVNGRLRRELRDGRCRARWSRASISGSTTR